MVHVESAAESEGAAARTSEGADERAEEEGEAPPAALCSDALEKTGRGGRDIVTALCCVTDGRKVEVCQKKGERNRGGVCFVSVLCLFNVCFVFLLCLFEKWCSFCVYFVFLSFVSAISLRIFHAMPSFYAIG